MRSTLLLLLAGIGSASTGVAHAEIFRCVQADGSVRFVGDPSTCETATRQGLTREIQRFGASEAAQPPHADTDAAETGVPVQDGAVPAPEAAAPAALAGPDDRLDSLEELFLPARAAGASGHWEVVKEAPVDAAADPDFLRWGVREKQVRHYTHRDDAGRVRVCSVELWAFDSEGQARIAKQNLSFPNWRFERAGPVLVMLHAVSRERGERASHGVFPECSRLGARIAARAETLSR